MDFCICSCYWSPNGCLLSKYLMQNGITNWDTYVLQEQCLFPASGAYSCICTDNTGIHDQLILSEPVGDRDGIEYCETYWSLHSFVDSPNSRFAWIVVTINQGGHQTPSGPWWSATPQQCIQQFFPVEVIIGWVPTAPSPVLGFKTSANINLHWLHVALNWASMPFSGFRVLVLIWRAAPQTWGMKWYAPLHQLRWTPKKRYNRMSICSRQVSCHVFFYRKGLSSTMIWLHGRRQASIPGHMEISKETCAMTQMPSQQML